MSDDEIERKLWEEDDTKHPRGKGQQGGQFVPKNQGQTSTTKPTAKTPAKKPAPKKQPAAPTPLDQLATKAYRNFGTFKEGDSGQEVRDIQELLNGLGLASPDGKKIYPDGKFGPATTAAIKAMQAKLGVKKPNGHMSASLMRKLQDTALLSPCAARSAVMEIAYEDLIERADTELDAADDLADESEVEEEPEHTGAMVALVPTAAEADRLAVEGFEPADELHVTLVYLGDAVDIDADTRNAIIVGLRGLVEDAVRPDYDLPLTADAFSVAVFNPQSEDFDACIVLGLSGSDLEEVHRLVDDTVDEAMGDVPDQHQPWLPHITLQYTDDTSRLDELFDRTGPVEFDRIRVAFGDEVTDIPLAPVVGRSTAVSDRPWGDFTQADYTPEEWARACLIHLTEDSYSKDDCKLPVREPDGTLNRNAVHSAAGRIHSVQASPDLKRQAAKALIHFYDDIGDDPPDSLMRLADDASRSDVEFWTQGAGRDRWLSSPTPAAILRTLLADHVTSAEAQQIATRCITHEFSTDRSDSG